MNSFAIEHDRGESPSAEDRIIGHTGSVFEGFFEQSVEAVWLLDPQTGVFVDCNLAAVKLIGAATKQELLRMRPEDLSPPFQPDGSPSAKKNEEITALIQKQKTHLFEWTMRRRDGGDIPIEVSATAVIINGRNIHIIISRDISERKKAERALLELTQALERRVTERTAELSASEARFRAMLEHAPEAIVVYSADTGRFLFGNQHACDLYGVPMAKLAELTPADVSPEFQSDGRLTSEVASEKVAEALAGKNPVFEWVHRRPDGQLIPTEVRLLHLPAGGQNLIRASIIDNTERKRAEIALRESEAKFRALFEGSSQGVMLHDENKFLEVNPAAVRIMGYQSAEELLGKYPTDTSPLFQPNGESSSALARIHIEECMTKGSARFEWMCCTPQGVEVPLEVALTRIQWSGREVIQAFITDISERRRAQAALAESEARFSAAFHASPAFLSVFRASDEKYVLVNDAYLNWLGYSRDEVMGRTCLELGIWENIAERDSVVKEMRELGSVRQRECRWHNRCGECATVLLSAETIKVSDAPHMLSMAVDITQRKRAEEELRESEARLRESEARFSAAFRASPVFITISRMDDGCYVLANEAFLKWTGYRLEQVLGRSSQELALWADPQDRVRFWEELRRKRFIHERECRVRDRHGKIYTMLISADIIEVNRSPHLLTVGLDISLRKQIEDELHRTIAREKELSQLKSGFVSMVSHEFRTPLGIIQSSAELLRDFYERMQRAEREDQLESIGKNARRMAGMMEEILVLSRLEANRLNFQPTALDLKRFLVRVVDEVLSATNRRCPIKLSLNSIVAEVQADERLLGHIITNLLSNAVKYSEPGAAVQFDARHEGDETVLVIRDRGIGIPEEDQRQLFNAFHRGSNVGTRPGTGLGLVLVKRCADLHGGKVQVESKVGEGATVTVRFPSFQTNHEEDIGH